MSLSCCGAMREGIGLTATNAHNLIESIGPLCPHELDCPLQSVVDFLKLTVRVLFNATKLATRSDHPRSSPLQIDRLSKLDPWMLTRAPILASWSELTTAVSCIGGARPTYLLNSHW